MQYEKIFDANVKPAGVTAARSAASVRGDRRDGRVYVYTEEIELAVNVALATSRPLLVRGPSGAGKSSLAQSVAFIQGWRYYEEVVSSRTQAQDLLWRFDAVVRLSDALDTTKTVTSLGAYVQPGVLWWGFDRASAAKRGIEMEETSLLPDPSIWLSDSARAVVLIDEIDKADPDVPNNLLVPIGSLEFNVAEIGVTVKADEPPLVVITTNDERELPNAFVRRCVVITITAPSRARLNEIATAHFGQDDYGVYDPIAVIVEQFASSRERRGRPTPSTAEYLDAISVCRSLGIIPGVSREWEAVVSALFEKTRRPNNGEG